MAAHEPNDEQHSSENVDHEVASEITGALCKNRGVFYARDVMGRIIVEDGLLRVGYPRLLFLISSLAKTIIETEKMTLEEAFDGITQNCGKLTLFDFKSAIARVEICKERESIEVLHTMMDTHGTGLVSKEDWVHVLLSANLLQKSFALSPFDDDDDMSVDIGLDHLCNWGDLVLFCRGPDSSKLDLSDRTVEFREFITFRSSRSCSMGQKSYYEIKILDTLSVSQFGFVTADCEEMRQGSGNGVGNCAHSWAVDGYRGKKWHVGAESYGTGNMWKPNDVVGLACNLNTRQIFVSINGSYDLPNGLPNGLVFQLDEDAVQHGLFAAFSARHGEIEYNLGDLPFKYGPPWPVDDNAFSIDAAWEAAESENSLLDLRSSIVRCVDRAQYW